MTAVVIACVTGAIGGIVGSFLGRRINVLRERRSDRRAS